MANYPIIADVRSVTNNAPGSAQGDQVSETIQLNPWGKAYDPYRSDLWYVDFSQAFVALKNELAEVTPSSTPKSKLKCPQPIHVQSVTFPDVRIKGEVLRRNSVPYYTPSWDEPLEPVTLNFILDSTTKDSIFYFLYYWLTLVRAGRESRSLAAAEFRLNKNFSVNYVFNLMLYLCQGNTSSVPGVSKSEQANAQKAKAYLGTLNYSDKYENVLAQTFNHLNRIRAFKYAAWLSSYKISDLDYKNSEIVKVEAKFYLEDLIMQEP